MRQPSLLIFSQSGLKQLIKRSAKLMDKKIKQIPVIDDLFDSAKGLAVGEERVERIIITKRID